MIPCAECRWRKSELSQIHKKMVLDFHGVASLQKVTNKGINPTATPQRLPPARPALLIYHFLLLQTNTTLIHSCHCGYNEVNAKA